MSVSEYFETFCINLRMKKKVVENIQNRYHQITKRINIDCYYNSSEITHSLYAGSDKNRKNPGEIAAILSCTKIRK
ncbi:MAG: hypothetical protein LBQ88_04960 [Treponema sp.]|jgi:hypothetical protein|nr:hypothetical protein [Treponema sp.]